MKTLRMLFVICFMVLGCEDPGEATYYETCSTKISGVYGGSVVEYKQGLVKVSLRETVCTGFLLNEDTVITAAHCFRGYTSRQGTDSFVITHYDPCLEKKVVISNGKSQYWIHPKFNSVNDYSNDLAIIKSPTPWIGTNENSYLSLWADYFSKVDYVTFYGLGYTNNDNSQNGILKRGSREVHYFNKSIVETRAGQVRYCHGDSGGPLFKRNSGDNLVLGVVSIAKIPATSRGDNCANWGAKQVGCRINQEKVEWIEKMTGATCRYSLSEHGYKQRTCRY